MNVIVHVYNNIWKRTDVLDTSESNEFKVIFLLAIFSKGRLIWNKAYTY